MKFYKTLHQDLNILQEEFYYYPSYSLKADEASGVFAYKCEVYEDEYKHHPDEFEKRRKRYEEELRENGYVEDEQSKTIVYLAKTEDDPNDEIVATQNKKLYDLQISRPDLGCNIMGDIPYEVKTYAELDNLVLDVCVNKLGMKDEDEIAKIMGEAEESIKANDSYCIDNIYGITTSEFSTTGLMTYAEIQDRVAKRLRKHTIKQQLFNLGRGKKK